MDLELKSRRDDLWRRDGDHARMIMAVRGFAAEHGDRRKWAETRGLSWRAMRGIMDIRKQLLALRERLTSSSGEEPVRGSTNTSTAVSHNTVRCLLAGFPLNAAILAPDGSYRTVSGRQPVAIHPSSVLFRRSAGETRSQQPKLAAIVYTEFVYTTRAYARHVSAVEVDWILAALGADWSPDESIQTGSAGSS
jgi:ATP-dependent RNA helicase DHR2